MSRRFLKSYYLFLPFLLVAWSFISILWSDNHAIAIFRSIKLLEFYLFYLYVTLRVVPRMFHSPRLAEITRRREAGACPVKCSTWNILTIIIILVASIQSVIAVIQIFLQKSIGLRFLQESLISTNIPGVAKIVINSHIYIRTYGLFPHPNILAGFLLFSIMLTLLYMKMFQPVEHSDAPRLPRWTNLFHVEQICTLWGGTIRPFIYLILAIQILALILTLSKSAILGLLITLFYIYVSRRKDYSTLSPINQDVPRGTSESENCSTWNNSRTRIIILSLLIALSLVFIASPYLAANLNQSFQERLTYLNVSRGTILANPVWGVGIGQFVWDMPRYSPVPLEVWQLQPVHNVFLLIWSELGIVGLGIFIYWLYRFFTAKPILRNGYSFLSINIPLRYFKGILLGFLFIMLFDHYFWDIQQGSLMLWMTLGMISGMKLYKDDNN